MAAQAPFDLSEMTVWLDRAGAASVVRQTRPPQRLDGLTIGVAVMARPAPHAGERHPDGDELLYVVAGRANVLLECADGVQQIELGVGAACVVPRGLWHRVVPLGEVTLLYATPGPNTERRPLASG
jgi:mannose-6-phosphate isomerase-like protein (cupin superfamily)